MTGIETLFAASAASGAAAGSAAAAGAAGGLAAGTAGAIAMPVSFGAMNAAVLGPTAGAAVTNGAIAAMSAGTTGAGLFSASNMLMASTALGLVSSIGQGMQGASAAEAQAAQFELQAQVEETQAAQREEARLKQLNHTLAGQRVVLGSRGIDVTGGTARTAAQQAAGAASRETAIDRTATDINAASARTGARTARSNARGAMWGGVASAGGSLLDYALKRNALGAV